MTQTRDRIPLRLQLTPMQLPEVTPQAVVRATAQSPTARMPSSDLSAMNVRSSMVGGLGCELVLYPGEASEILIQLENLGDRTLSIDVQVEGDFPVGWCRVGVEGHRLPPKGKMEAVLYFHPAADCFEAEDAIQPGETLRLDFQGRCIVSYAQEVTEPGGDRVTGQIAIESAHFNLYLRPRSLYTNFLPEIYGEVDLIGRLLKIFEQTFEPAVQTLDVLWAHLDPLTAPEAMLPFLAHWVGWPLNDWNREGGISLERQRYLIARAMELYRWRGTKRGLRLYLHLYTDLPLDETLPEAEKHISIQEVFGRGFVMGATSLNQDAIIGGGQPYHFLVQLRSDNRHPINERLVRQIIEQEKPAFCTYELVLSAESVSPE